MCLNLYILIWQQNQDARKRREWSETTEDEIHGQAKRATAEQEQSKPFKAAF